MSLQQKRNNEDKKKSTIWTLYESLYFSSLVHETAHISSDVACIRKVTLLLRNSRACVLLLLCLRAFESREIANRQ